MVRIIFAFFTAFQKSLKIYMIILTQLFDNWLAEVGVETGTFWLPPSPN